MGCSWFFGLRDWQGHFWIKGQLVNKMFSKWLFSIIKVMSTQYWNILYSPHCLGFYPVRSRLQWLKAQVSIFQWTWRPPVSLMTSKQGRNMTDSVCVVKALEIMRLCYLSPHNSEFTETTVLKCWDVLYKKKKKKKMVAGFNIISHTNIFTLFTMLTIALKYIYYFEILSIWTLHWLE